MKELRAKRNGHWLMLFVSMFTLSCAAIPRMQVTYQIPGESDVLRGKTVYLAFEDRRTRNDIIGEGAREDYKNFSGSVILFLAQGKEERVKLGIYDLPSLFKEAFKRRLERLGVSIDPARGLHPLGLVIYLKDFTVDLQGREWVVTMDYEARLEKEGKILSSQSVAGQAERYKIFGLAQADIVVGELFTDMVNRLDVVRLFQQAHL
jgi:hypothetical protein